MNFLLRKVSGLGEKHRPLFFLSPFPIGVLLLEVRGINMPAAIGITPVKLTASLWYQVLLHIILTFSFLLFFILIQIKIEKSSNFLTRKIFSEEIELIRLIEGKASQETFFSFSVVFFLVDKCGEILSIAEIFFSGW